MALIILAKQTNFAFSKLVCSLYKDSGNKLVLKYLKRFSQISLISRTPNSFYITSRTNHTNSILGSIAVYVGTTE